MWGGGGGNPYIDGLSIVSKHYFSLVMRGFSGNNAPYSALLSFMMLPSFDIIDYYYFESNLSLVLLIKLFPTKKCNAVLLLCGLLNMKK